MNSINAIEKWSYAVGNVPFSVKEAVYANFVIFYYTQVNGLSGSLAGLAMFISLVWDAISDPIVGSWSDNFRSSWGRRHPLLVLGALPTTLLFFWSICSTFPFNRIRYFYLVAGCFYFITNCNDNLFCTLYSNGRRIIN